ncbi:MAG: 16S rRNA (guanine(527)-N(7))-methyltransferase RsmG [Chloroflexi bacterium]|nr:MAG: 16S rRNA (guanine(527)-N(7))-methyltransferase RsmG [Chloroflexota bacterium]
MSRRREPLPTRVEGLPPLPVEYADVLEACLADLRLSLPPDARRAIDDHARLLLAWTGSINLTAIRDLAGIARLHVADSLTAVEPLRARGVDSVIDLGSGGGYPGLPLAVALPAARTLLVDSVGKKAAFLETVVDATGLAPRVRVAAERGEALAADPRHRERWQAVTIRAVGSVANAVELGFPLLRPGGCVVAWKRLPIDEELAAARRAVDALGGGTIEVVRTAVRGLDDHVLAIATKRGRTATRYPRDPAERARRPW